MFSDRSPIRFLSSPIRVFVELIFDTDEDIHDDTPMSIPIRTPVEKNGFLKLARLYEKFYSPNKK